MYFFDSMDFAFPKGSATSNSQIFWRDTWYSHYYMNNFVFVNNPDGTLGVYYDPNNFTGSTDTIQNFTTQITEEYCNVLNNKFEETRSTLIKAFYAGEKQLPECSRLVSSYTCASETFATFFQTYTYRNIPNCYWDRRRNVCVTKSHPFDDTICCGDDFTIDFDKLTTEPLSGATTNEKFDLIMNTELVDAKTRKTISAYPTLRALYDRYMASNYYTGVQSSAYDYDKMDGIANKVGNNWIDVIEQLVPATTIWGSVKVYENTVFDQQKFKYKLGTTFTCYDNQDDIIGYDLNVGVDKSNIYPVSGTTASKVTKCTGVYMKQIDFGSEFLGSVTIIGDEQKEHNETIYSPSIPTDGYWFKK